MRRHAVLALPLVLPALVVVAGAPAYAADNIICVGNPAGISCDASYPTLEQAISEAGSNAVDDTIYLGPGTYDDGQYNLDGRTHHLTLIGDGVGTTFLTEPTSSSDSDNFLEVTEATVRDLTVQMSVADSAGDVGLTVDGGMVSNVSVVGGSGIEGATGVVSRGGSSLADVTVDLPLGGDNDGIQSYGSLTLADSSVTARWPYYREAGGSDVLSRVTLTAGGAPDVVAVDVRDGTVDVDDAVVALGDDPGATGIRVQNLNDDAVSMAFHADHVTLVGGGTGAVGVLAATTSAVATQTATVTLDNSIVQVDGMDLRAQAGNNGVPLDPSTATITATYSDFSTSDTTSTNGSVATVAFGAGNVDEAPGFVDAASGNYRLRATSPLVDLGAPATGGPAFDRDGSERVADGNGDGTKRRDIGAYERPRVPSTTITDHPRKRVTTRKVRFAFKANVDGPTFRCRMDNGAWSRCASPKTFRVSVGRHTFSVKASDQHGATDPTPATFTFRRVRR